MPIDAAAVRSQYQRFSRQWDDTLTFAGFAALLNQHLAQPLSDSEAAWTYQALANVHACRRSRAGKQWSE